MRSPRVSQRWRQNRKSRIDALNRRQAVEGGEWGCDWGRSRVKPEHLYYKATIIGHTPITSPSVMIWPMIRISSIRNTLPITSYWSLSQKSNHCASLPYRVVSNLLTVFRSATRCWNVLVKNSSERCRTFGTSNCGGLSLALLLLLFFPRWRSFELRSHCRIGNSQ